MYWVSMPSERFCKEETSAIMFMKPHLVKFKGKPMQQVCRPGECFYWKRVSLAHTLIPSPIPSHTTRKTCRDKKVPFSRSGDMHQVTPPTFDSDIKTRNKTMWSHPSHAICSISVKLPQGAAKTWGEVEAVTCRSPPLSHSQARHLPRLVFPRQWCAFS